MSFVSSTSKVLDLVFFAEYLSIVSCGSSAIATRDFLAIESCGDEHKVHELVAIGWTRFVCTFIVGFLGVGFVRVCGLRGTGSIGSFFMWFLIVPILVAYKVIMVGIRMYSVSTMHAEIERVKGLEIEHIPLELQLYYGSVVALPDTLLSGSMLLAVAVIEITAYFYIFNANGIALRVLKIVFGAVSLVMAVKDARMLKRVTSEDTGLLWNAVSASLKRGRPSIWQEYMKGER